MTEQPGKRIRVEVEEIAFDEFVALISRTGILIASNIQLLQTAQTREWAGTALRRIIEISQNFPQRVDYKPHDHDEFIQDSNLAVFDFNQEKMKAVSELQKLLLLFKTTSVLHNARFFLLKIAALAKKYQTIIGITGETIDIQPNYPRKLLP